MLFGKLLNTLSFSSLVGRFKQLRTMKKINSTPHKEILAEEVKRL